VGTAEPVKPRMALASCSTILAAATMMANVHPAIFAQRCS